jgi:phage replication initiation protein
MLDLLGFTDGKREGFKGTHGVRGYANKLQYEGITIHYGDRDEVWCEMSGQGCRTFETYGSGDWQGVLETIRDDPDGAYHLTRLDVAYDDRAGLLDLGHIYRETKTENYVSNIEDWESIETKRKGRSIYLGSKKSDMFVRIYDKAKERGREAEGHWVRFEIQMRDKKAGAFLDFLLLRTIGETFAGVVGHYIRYVTPKESDSHRYRWPTADWWRDFIGDAERISLYRAPGTEYNLSKANVYVYGQAGAAAGALLEIEGEDAFLEILRSRYLGSTNPKYRTLVGKHV